MMTKMTGFDKSAYNQSNFEYEEIVQEDDNSKNHMNLEGVQLPKYYQELVFEPEVVPDELIKENAINSLETNEYKLAV